MVVGGDVDVYRSITTMREGGVVLVISSWHGVFAPKGTPAAIVAQVSEAVGRLSARPDFVQHMGTLLLGVRYLNAAAFQKFFADEDTQYRRLIDKLDLYVAPETAK